MVNLAVLPKWSSDKLLDGWWRVVGMNLAPMLGKESYWMVLKNC
jgi:hypothetical protein